MFLKRIQINDFKVLKDIDISFDEKFTPKVFPLGSINGGGKSTLLQLIFTLLNCSFDENKKQFVKNILESFELNDDEKEKSLAKIELIHNNENIVLDFFVATDDILEDENLSFSVNEKLKILNNQIDRKKKQAVYIKIVLKELKDFNFDENTDPSFKIENLVRDTIFGSALNMDLKEKLTPFIKDPQYFFKVLNY